MPFSVFYRWLHDCAQQAQSALEAIRARTPALAWKSARGEYAGDDAQLDAWYAARVTAGTWPPEFPGLKIDA